MKFVNYGYQHLIKKTFIKTHTIKSFNITFKQFGLIIVLNMKDFQVRERILKYYPVV